MIQDDATASEYMYVNRAHYVFVNQRT